MMGYVTRDRETGTIIEYFKTKDEAEQAIRGYEESDEREGIYEADFYEIAKGE